MRAVLNVMTGQNFTAKERNFLVTILAQDYLAVVIVDSDGAFAVRLASYDEKIGPVRDWYSLQHQNWVEIDGMLSKWKLWDVAIQDSKKSICQIQDYLDRIARGRLTIIWIDVKTSTSPDWSFPTSTLLPPDLSLLKTEPQQIDLCNKRGTFASRRGRKITRSLHYAGRIQVTLERLWRVLSSQLEQKRRTRGLLRRRLVGIFR